MGRGVQLLFGCLSMDAVFGIGGARGGGIEEAQLNSPGRTGGYVLDP